MYVINRPHLGLARAFLAAEQLFGATREMLISRSRREPLASLRALLCCYLHEQMHVCAQQIADAVGRDRSSINYYVAQHRDRLITDREYSESYYALQARMEQGWEND